MMIEPKQKVQDNSKERENTNNPSKKVILFTFLLNLNRLKYLHFFLTLNEATLDVRGGKTKVLFFVVLVIGRCRARGQWNDLFTVPLLVQPPPCILRQVPYVLSSAGRSSVKKNAVLQQQHCT